MRLDCGGMTTLKWTYPLIIAIAIISRAEATRSVRVLLVLLLGTQLTESSI
jgi:hypothetical protein